MFSFRIVVIARVRGNGLPLRWQIVSHEASEGLAFGRQRLSFTGRFKPVGFPRTGQSLASGAIKRFSTSYAFCCAFALKWLQIKGDDPWHGKCPTAMS